ncbi:hypothetical protein X801_05188, partial [Opisthorchis viverrini]
IHVHLPLFNVYVNYSIYLIDSSYLHGSLCHSGITRLMNFVPARDLLFSSEEFRSVTTKWPIYSEVGPRFYSHLTRSS